MNRASLMATLDTAFGFAATSIANANQGGLFDMMGDDALGSSTAEPPWPMCCPGASRS
jgi:DNA polymerase-3 subunit alpha